MLNAESLSKEFPTRSGPLTVLRDVSLSLATARAVAIMGPSGRARARLLNITGDAGAAQPWPSEHRWLRPVHAAG